ncbi:hypothetical protein VA596_22520 [Amycolatopsis sp., V23-08]|uniref:Membrane protein involved in the export of O-antigen and teichoic acid n=1 Tax=Amycolatopsis heterodermiae TaxID=3110235 RepID=A0ABU5R9L1_9PSEU|nr:hypothetical protein [Amycolatopsis sp., V23-08]MEA5362329.1 hypothetical protein [Amycolatopsis sp., V23-08]
MAQRRTARTTLSGHGFRAVLSAALRVGGGQLVAQALTGIQLLVVARHTGTAAFGEAAAWYGVASALVPLCDFGASARLLRDGGRLGGPPPGAGRLLVVRKSAVLAGPTAVVLLVSAVLGLPVMLVGLAVAYGVARAALLVVQADWQLRGRAGVAAGVAAGERLVALVAGLSLTAAGVPAAAALLGGLLAGTAVMLTRRAPFEPGPATGPIRYGLRFAGAGVAGNLALLDTVVVTAVAGPVQAGYYALGARLLGPLLVLVTAAGTAVLPSLATGAPAAVRVVRLIGVTSAVASAAVFLTAGRLVPLVAGPAFAAAVPAVRWYLAALVCVVAAQLLVLLRQARGDEVAMSILLPAGVATGLAAIAVGAHTGGAAGAAAGYAAACVVVLGVLTWRHFSRRDDTARQ